MDHFALGGVLIYGPDREKVIQMHTKFCSKWDINYPLHSTDIRGKRYDFTWLGDEEKNREFLKDLHTFMCEIPVLGFATVIDRTGYNNRYKAKHNGQPWWLCKTAFSILIERVSKYVEEKEMRFKIISEICGPKEEEAIKSYFKSLRKDGVPFEADSSTKYKPAKPALFQRIPYGDPEFHEKESPLLQVADLYLYPIAKGGYVKDDYVYQLLMRKGKLIDAVLPAEMIETRGIKYSCFDAR